MITTSELKAMVEKEVGTDQDSREVGINVK